MYNGIGLTTARGSGTNGFVQKNLSHVPTKQKRIEYKSEEELKYAESELARGPNLEILQHARKRQIELKCLEMRELMEEQDYTEEEIEQKVSKFRKMLFEKEAASGETKLKLEKDQFGRIVAKDSHEIAQAQTEKNKRFKEALGLPSDYVDGSSLEKLSTREAVQKYDFVNDVDNEPDVPWTNRIEEAGSNSEAEDNHSRKEKRPTKKSDKSGSESESSGRSTSPMPKSRHRHKKSKHRESRQRFRSRSRSRSDDFDGDTDRRQSHKKSKHRKHRRHSDD